MVLLEGISLSGEHVVGMQDKKVSVAKAPFYRTFEEEGKEAKKKVCIPLKLADGSVLEWFANKRSLRTLGAWFGFEMDKWIAKKFSLTTAKQNVQGNMKDVIYVDEKAPHDS